MAQPNKELMETFIEKLYTSTEANLTPNQIKIITKIITDLLSFTVYSEETYEKKPPRKQPRKVNSSV